MALSQSLKWHPLELFDERFRANLAALRQRDEALAARLEVMTPSTPFFIAAERDDVFLGRPAASGIEVMADPAPPPSARKMLKVLFPKDQISWSIAIGGLGYGWLWDRISKLPCKCDSAPGHRPPVYLLTNDPERLWAVLHVMDWVQLLADPRFRIIVGPDAWRQLNKLLVDNPSWPQPKASLGVEPGIFPADLNLLLKSIDDQIDGKAAGLRAQIGLLYPDTSGAHWAARLSGSRLRVLGITCRYTTFLQYSMQDWLAAFERLGHETKMVIEPADHLVLGPTGVAQAILDFQPDLIVIIDHYRAELESVPPSIPCVMYVQDRLNNIFSLEGGQKQSARDYCVGFGRLHLSQRYGYPAERFLPSPVGINELRFDSEELSPEDRERFGCDVSYVSHASRPADQLMREHVVKSGSPLIARLCDDLYQRMEAWYAQGGPALGDVALKKMVEQGMESTCVQLEPHCVPEIVEFLNHSVSNSMFRHQSLLWLAEMGVRLNIWGKGWDSHPKLCRYARGIADNRVDLPKIYRASKINLQVIPHGAVHQRLLDGLAAGAFFLIRHTPGDAAGMPYLRLWEWCRRNGINSDAQMRTQADAEARNCIAQIDALLGYDTAAYQTSLYECLEATADSDFLILASAIWPEHYSQVAFDSRDELQAKVEKYLGDESTRGRIAQEMRQVVIDKCSYVSINHRLLKFIQDDLHRQARMRVAA